MAISRLPGGAALSGFRLEKLNAALGAKAPGLRVVSAQHWHFVETDRVPSDADRAVLERLLRYGFESPAPSGGADCLRLVVPRLGTPSPWSPRATDIARQCGLDFVRRIERGTAFHLGGLDPDAALPLIHDPLTEKVPGAPAGAEGP